MENWLLWSVYLLIFPGIGFAMVVGILASWVDRKVTARIQFRVGPPLLQPVYDLVKLVGKEVVIPVSAQPGVFLLAPLVGFVAAALSAVILGVNNFLGQSFLADLIVLVYLLLIPSLAIIVGGSASGNPHSSIGASREMKLVMAYELPLILAIVTVIINAGFSLDLAVISAEPQISSISGVLAFIVSLICIQAKLAEVPFDIPEAETELMEGPLLEYSGLPLAIFKATHMLLLYLLPLYLITIFLGGIGTGYGIIWGGLKYLLIIVLIILIKNTNPRLRIDQAVVFFWTWMTALAGLAVLLAGVGNIYGIGWL